MHPFSRQRIFYLDLIRVIACFFVIMMHASLYNFDVMLGSISFNIYALTFNISSKLFFMLSGALLLPINRAPRAFVKHRLAVILVPLAIWSLAYFIERLAIDNPSKDEIKRTVLSIFFTPVESSLWFVYAMAGFYVMMPLISKCIEVLDKRWIEYYLALWVISGFIPYISGVFYPVIHHHNILASANNFLGYIILGYYLHRYEPPLFNRQNIAKTALAFTLICIGLPVFVLTYQASYYITSPSDQLAVMTHDLGINTMLTGIIIFSAIQKLAKHFASPSQAETPSLARKAVASISICSFGIYLSHILVYRLIVWKYIAHIYQSFTASPLLVDAMCAATCFAISYIIIRIIHLLPFSRYITGH